MIRLTIGEALTILACVSLLSAALGSIAQTWWQDYMRDTIDARSIRQHERATQRLREWN